MKLLIDKRPVVGLASGTKFAPIEPECVLGQVALTVEFSGNLRNTTYPLVAKYNFLKPYLIQDDEEKCLFGVAKSIWSFDTSTD